MHIQTRQLGGHVRNSTIPALYQYLGKLRICIWHRNAEHVEIAFKCLKGSLWIMGKNYSVRLQAAKYRTNR